MDHNLWNGVEYEKWAAIHDMYYLIAEKHQTLKIWNWNEVMKYGMKWMKYGMKWSMNEWSEMEYGWVNEMEYEWMKWNGP